MHSRRRALHLAGAAAAVAAAYGGAGLLRRFTEADLDFDSIPGLPGFRRVAGGALSPGRVALSGIGGTDGLPALDNGALCAALFEVPAGDGPVRIAYFSDVRCLYCREISPVLAGMEREGAARVTWHELPLLGEVSRRAARAMIAARTQGAYAAFHARLMGSPVVPTPPYLRSLAREAGIDPDRLLSDMSTPETDRQLQTSAALAARFGFYGTPSFVIGRTAMTGGATRRRIERLIALETRAPDPPPC